MSKRSAAEVPAPSALTLDDYLPYRLSVASNAVSQLIARAYEDRFGISVPQWRMIAVVSEFGPMTPLQIGARTQMDKVTVSRASQDLVARRLLKRSEHGQDGRSHLLKLTTQGEALYAEVAPLALQMQEELLRDFPPAQIAAAKQLLRALQQKALALQNRN